MTIDKYLPLRIYLKTLRKIPATQQSDVSIKSGPLKGYKWNVQSTTNDFFTGLYEREFVDLVLTKLKPTDVFYDIGANAGYFSMIASSIIKKGNSIYAFEPVPYLFEVIKHHAKINKTNTLKVYPYAISNKNGTVQFSNLNNTGGNTYISESELFQNSDKMIDVKSITIDKFIEEENASVPTVLKIDAEGAEFDVLQGAENTLRKYKPLLFLSTHDIHLPGVKEKCLNFLKELDYTIEEKDEDSKGKKIGLDDFIAY